MTRDLPDALSRLRAVRTQRDLTSALALFDELPPVAVNEMMGAWRGFGVDTGNPFDGLLEAYGWRGKRFDAADAAHPLVFEDARGAFSVDPAGLPLVFAIRHSALLRNRGVASAARKIRRLRRTTAPKARLRMIEYRGVVTGTMSYDALPINDHFRRVDDNTLLGAMDLRGLDAPFIFVLRRDGAGAL